MTYSRITTNLLDLWAEPRFNSERKSQVLHDEIVALGRRKAGFVQVRESDGYSGWLDDRFLSKITKLPLAPPKGWFRAVVTDETAPFIPHRGCPTIPPYFIYYGTRLTVRPVANGIVEAKFNDGSTQWISRHSLTVFDGTPRDNQFDSIVKEARKFLGVPYLWGGVTSSGFDCSGLVRSIFRQFDVALPRDAKDQIKCGVECTRESARPGDLIFFERHVGIAMSQNRVIHASRGGGGVRINSLVKSGKDYRADLDRDLRAVRRIL